MTLEFIINIGIQVLFFLAASYFIFYKSWLKSLGTEMAKLSTVEQLTRETEKVKKEFNEKIESYKTKLSEELASKIEPLKSELAKSNITHQVQFSFLHQERGKVILELYKKLIELHSAMLDWTRSMHPIIEDKEKEEQERGNRVNLAINDFRNFYLVNKLYFSETFCDYIDEVFKVYQDKGWDYGYKQGRLKSGHLTHEYYKTYLEEMHKISNDLKDSLPPKIQEIEQKFRQMLSVEEE